MSKRTLYKPVQQENVTTKPNRKPLAQGRLVTKSFLPHSGETLDAQRGGSGKSITSSPKGVLVSAPRRDLSQHMQLDRTGSLDSSNPRRQTPHASLNKSPPALGPSLSLELSDTENEDQHNKTPPEQVHRNLADVLVVDALHQTKSLNDSEVDIKVAFEHSPIKVVCHSPSRAHSNLRDTGDVQQSRQVKVDHMPTVSILGADEDSADVSAPRPPPLFKSPLVVKEKTIAGRPVDKHSAAKPHMPDTDSMQPTSEDEFPESSPLYTLPMPVLGRGRADSESSVASSISTTASIHQESPTLHEETTKVITGPPRAKSVTITDQDITGKVKKKKKAPRYVESRCMQAAAAVAKKGPMKATDRSILTKSTVSRKNTSAACPSKVSKKLSRSMDPGNAPVKKKSTPVRFSATPEPRGKDRASSTPTADGSTFKGHDVDVSAIALPGYHHQSHHSSGLESSSLSDSGPAVNRKHSISTDTRGIPEVTQQDLDVAYNRYLQWLFLHSKAKKELKEQEKQFMSQAYALWEATEEKRKRCEDLELMLTRLKHMKLVDQALETQSAGLAPVVSGLPHLGQQYTTLAQALDTSRHQMPTKGVHIPHDQDAYMDQLGSALAESEMLLAELSSMCHQQAAPAHNFSRELQNLEASVQEQAIELRQVQEHLNLAHTMATQESSLKTQDLQLM